MMDARHWATLACAALLAGGCEAGDGGNNAAAGARGDSSTGGAGQASRTVAEALALGGGLGQFNRAVEAAGLADTLRGGGRYTVFAPVDAAFERMPEETRNRLMAAEGREQLTELLSYHIVPGVVTTQDIVRAMERGGGRATLATVSRANLTFSREGEAVFVTDAAGGRARISLADQIQSNGVIHHIDGILIPGAAQAE